jgi:hypothetical protein
MLNRVHHPSLEALDAADMPSWVKPRPGSEGVEELASELTGNAGLPDENVVELRPAARSSPGLYDA